MNIAELVAAQARSHPDRPALIHGSGRSRRVVTMAELDARAAAAAAWFAGRGIAQGDAVLVLQPMGVMLYVLLLALFRIGATAVAPDASALTTHIAAACRRIAPRAMVGPARAHLLRLLVPELRRVALAISTDRSLPFTHRLDMGADIAIAVREVDPATAALLTFTSGSTGAPKAIVRSHAFLLAQHEAVASVLRPVPGTASLVTLPMFVLSNLASGVASVLPASQVARPAQIDIDAIAQQIADESVVQLLLSPIVAERLADTPPAKLATVRSVFTGGGPVHPDMLDALQVVMPSASLHSAYGSSEAEPIAEFERAALDAPARARIAHGLGLFAGRPGSTTSVSILPDRFGSALGPFDEATFAAVALAPGQVGEIVVAGPHVLGSYLDGIGDGETKIRVGDRIWHRTGDAGSFDEAGRLWLHGRCSARLMADDRVRYPLAIEAALRCRYPKLRAACIDTRDGILVAVEQRAIDETLIDAARSLGVASLRGVARLPLDRRHNSKIDYPALRRQLGVQP